MAKANTTIDVRIVDATSPADAPELRMLDADPASLEIRAEEGKPTKLTGIAAVFNSLSADLGGFKERIIPGAFRSSLSGTTDIRALVDHDPAKILGRTSSGTLRLWEDAIGLRFEVELPDTSYARDLMESVKRKDIRGASFGFRVLEKGDRILNEAGEIIRELLSVSLKEVTVTSIPAYAATSVQLRVDPSLSSRIATAAGTPKLDEAKRRLRLAELAA